MACIRRLPVFFTGFIQPMTHTPQVDPGPRRLLTTLRATGLWLVAALLLWSTPPARAITFTTSYTLPAALTSAPFNCVMATATIYDCSGSISLDKDAELYLTSNLTLRVGGNFTSQKNLTTNNNGYTFQLTVGGSVSMQKDTDVDINITAGGNIAFAKNARVDGNLQSGGSLTLSKDSTVNGNVTVGANLTGAKNVIINGSCTVTGSKINITCTGGATALHHVRATYAPSTTTCAGTSVTVTACNSADSSGSCTAYTGGVSGTLTADAIDDTDLGSVAFSIPSGSSSATVTLPAITAEQTAYLSFDNLSKTTTTKGTCWNGSDNLCELVVGSCGVHHVRLDHGGAGVTCVPASVTVNACSGADTGGSCTLNTSGISGNVQAKTAGGAVLATVPFTIAAGQSSATVSVPVTTAQTATFSTSALSSTPTSGTTCWNGSAASCNYTYADSGFVFDIPDHRAGVSQTVTFKAVKKADNSSACVPTLPDGTNNVYFSCSYSDPSSGTKSLSVAHGGTSKSIACNAGAAVSLPMAFSNGASQLVASYPDAGEVMVTAAYASGSTAIITGNDTFIAAPTSFVIGTTTTALQADVGFSATVTAVNASGAAMPNFGRESNGHRASVTFSRCGGVTAGVFSGGLSSAGLVNMPAFTNGVSTATGLKYSEVGTLDASVAMTSSGYTTPSTYMSTGLAVTGTTNTGGSSCSGSFGAATATGGKFGPAYLQVDLNPTTTKFAYSGVPFNIRVTAKNGSGGTTKNYYSPTYARDIALSAVTSTGTAVAGTVGTLNTTSISASAFGTLVSSNNNPAGYADQAVTFTFPAVTGGATATLLRPQTIYLRAAEASPGTATSASGASPSLYDAKVEMRYGRLRLFNAYASSLSSLRMPVQAEYWNGSVWVVNGDDSTTIIKPASVGFYGAQNVTPAGPASDTKLDAGKGTLTISNTQSPKVKGWTYVTTNLGNSTGDNAFCIGATKTPVGGTAANSLPGLRSYYGCENGAYISDPAARAVFGVQSQETKGIVHVREVFN